MIGKLAVIVCWLVAAPPVVLAGPATDRAQCVMDLGKPGIGGIPVEHAPPGDAADRLVTHGAKDVAQLEKRLAARMPSGVTIALDATGMNRSTTLTGARWADPANIDRFIHEHPCLFGLTADIDIHYDKDHGLRSKTGFWGVFYVEPAPGTKTVVLEQHLWPIRRPATIDLSPWIARFPDVNANLNAPDCDPTPGGPPDECAHQHDPRMVHRVREEMIVVSPAPRWNENFSDAIRADTQIFEPSSGDTREPGIILEWNRPTVVIVAPTTYGQMPCFHLP